MITGLELRKHTRSCVFVLLIAACSAFKFVDAPVEFIFNLTICDTEEYEN